MSQHYIPQYVLGVTIFLNHNEGSVGNELQLAYNKPSVLHFIIQMIRSLDRIVLSCTNLLVSLTILYLNVKTYPELSPIVSYKIDPYSKIFPLALNIYMQ